MIKTCKVQLDEITAKLASAFDYDFTGESSFETPKFTPPSDFDIGLIVGNSGSGKTLLLKEHFKISEEPIWNPELSIAAHFSSYDEACEKLFAVGLSSIPTLCRPYHVLSNGEAYRARMARIIGSGACVDEFSSVVDRAVAKCISVAISKYVKKKDLRNIVFCSCHFDIIEWLCPSWVFCTDNNDFVVNKFALDKFPKLGSFEIS